MNQSVDFWVNKDNPAFEKSFPDIKAFVLMGDRGEKKNQVGFLWYFESAAVRDKYFPKEDDKNMYDTFKAGSEMIRILTPSWASLLWMQGGNIPIGLLNKLVSAIHYSSLRTIVPEV